MSKEAKKYFIPANEELVEVSEELYREYYRPIWNTRYHVRKNGECSCTKAQLWKCDGVCPGCPFYTAGKKVSLDTVIGGENDELTLEEVRAVCAEKSRAGFTAEVKSIITKRGADKLSAIKPEEYAAVLAEVEVLGNAD